MPAAGGIGLQAGTKKPTREVVARLRAGVSFSSGEPAASGTPSRFDTRATRSASTFGSASRNLARPVDRLVLRVEACDCGKLRNRRVQRRVGMLWRALVVNAVMFGFADVLPQRLGDPSHFPMPGSPLDKHQLAVTCLPPAPSGPAVDPTPGRDRRSSGGSTPRVAAYRLKPSRSLIT